MPDYQELFRERLKQRYENKKILILGFGREGKTSYHFLRRLLPNQHFWLMDEAAIDRQEGIFWLEEKQGFDENISCLTGGQYLQGLEEYDLIFKTPGLPGYLLKEMDPQKITSQTNEFVAQIGERVIGITGTKGKSTTSSLIYEGLKALGQDTLLVGNIGKPALELLLEDAPERLYVYEMSSHQTQFLRFAPRIGIILNLFEEHLDNYTDYEEYIQAKLNLARYDRENTLFLYGCDNAKLKEYASVWQSRRHQAFGMQENNSFGDEGVFIRDEQIVLRFSPHTDAVPTSVQGQTADRSLGAKLCSERLRESFSGQEKKEPVQGGDVKDGAVAGEQRLGGVDFPRRLLGRHNLGNALAVFLVVRELMGLDEHKAEIIFRAIGEFAGLEHRLEYVGSFAGRDFYNDSISTIPAAALEAIRSIPRLQTLIIGGYDRGISYEGFTEALNCQTELKLICLPHTGHKIFDELRHTGKYKARDMKEAVELAFAVTEKGFACALSPAAASYTFYRNFEERGRDFKEQIRLCAELERRKYRPEQES